MALDTITPRFLVNRNGFPLVGRRPALVYDAGTKVNAQVVFRRNEGEVVDLTGYGTPTTGATIASGEYRVNVRIFEAARGGSNPSYTTVAEVTDAEGGEATFVLLLSCKPGIYRAELNVEDSDGNFLNVYRAYIYANPSFVTTESWRAFPSIEEFRLGIRDSCPEENLLIDEIDFCAAEICEATVRAVQRFNELPPMVATYGTDNFPYRGSLIEGAKAQLYLLGAEFYRRNRMAHQAGQFSVDDLNRAKDYEEIGRTTWSEYSSWVMQEKTRVNYSQGFAVLH